MHSTKHQQAGACLRRARGREGCGFSLVELVIVIVIIGVIAAIAIPRLTQGASGAGEAALVNDLAALRRAIEVYAAEHNGSYPGSTADGTGNGADTDGAFANQLAKYSSETGAVSDTRDTTFRFGPYLLDVPAAPVGANKGSRTVAIDTANTPPLVAVGTDGWVYNPRTGAIIVNTDDANLAGTRAYDGY